LSSGASGPAFILANRTDDLTLIGAVVVLLEATTTENLEKKIDRNILPSKAEEFLSV